MESVNIMTVVENENESLSNAEGITLAAELRDLQAYGGRRLAEKGHSLGDVDKLVRQVLKEADRSANERSR
jgi:hypothetical protein